MIFILIVVPALPRSLARTSASAMPFTTLVKGAHSISLPFSHKKVASPELRDHGRPQTPDFGGLFIDGGLYHDQLRGRINEDALPEVPQERELPSAAGKQVDLIDVPEPSLGFCQIRLGGAHRGRINHPLC